jgi:hypothetical protein
VQLKAHSMKVFTTSRQECPDCKSDLEQLDFKRARAQRCCRPPSHRQSTPCSLSNPLASQTPPNIPARSNSTHCPRWASSRYSSAKEEHRLSAFSDRSRVHKDSWSCQCVIECKLEEVYHAIDAWVVSTGYCPRRRDWTKKSHVEG